MDDDDDNDLFFDPDFTLPETQEENNTNLNEPEDDFGDDFGDDLDLTELVQVTDIVEQEYAANQITFVPQDDTDPTPPPALPENTASFHPLDVEKLRTWIYPTNYPIRGYQLNILQKAMFHNTLVALPTGLGKTFIAAVVMFNYWRWFPNSIVVFMAPTRPLVTQQIEACYTICGLPQEETVDISGNVAPEKRAVLWKTKRVFFATPQTVFNDLCSNACPAIKISCLVVDEAHRATGNYAYTQVVRQLTRKNKEFRMLALTATPGSSLDTVQTVVDNLHIANIQIRTEDSMDIREYSHGKNTESIIVPLGYTDGSTGMVPRIIDEFTTKLFEPLLQGLSKFPTGINPDPYKCSAFGLNSSRKRFQLQADNINNNLKFKITCMFLVAEQMGRAFDLLCQHGIGPFVESIEATRQECEATMSAGKKLNKSQSEYYHNSYLISTLSKLKREMEKPDFIGHPKIDTLVSVLLKHFANLTPGETSKVMIFSSYRSSVNAICQVLNRHSPMIRSSFFVGQAEGKNGLKGLKQTEQQEVIRKFKNDEFNVIVCTSIGEEGLDIGEVDLIICYDSQSSPIRMLQRMGRTGRKRQGKCILLMTESEERKFKQAKESYTQIQKLINQGTYLTYFKSNPSVIPKKYKPTLSRQRIEIGQYQPTEKKKTRQAKSILNMSADGYMQEMTEKAFVNSFCNAQEHYTTVTQVMQKYWPTKSLMKSLNKHVPLQITPKPTHRIGHSKRTLDFVQLVQKMEHRIMHPDEEIQFNMPKQQTRLIIPSKSKASSSTKLVMPKRKKPRHFNDDRAELAMFYDPEASIPNQEEDPEATSFFLDNSMDNEELLLNDTPSESPVVKRQIHDFFVPKKKLKLDHSLPKAPITDGVDTRKKVDKGKGVDRGGKRADKGKGVDKGKDVDIGKPESSKGFESLDHDGDWEPLLPESVYDDIIPLPSTPVIESQLTPPSIESSAQQQQQLVTSSSVSLEQKQLTPPSIEFSAQQYQQLVTTSSESPKQHQLTPPDIKFSGQQQQQTPRLIEERVTIVDMDELYNIPSDEDSFDYYDDFPLDDLILKETEESWYVSDIKGFESILPVFPFETKGDDSANNNPNNITFVWPQKSTIQFSEKALALLEKRQQAVKQCTGKFVAINMITKYNTHDSNVDYDVQPRGNNATKQHEQPDFSENKSQTTVLNEAEKTTPPVQELLEILDDVVNDEMIPSEENTFPFDNDIMQEGSNFIMDCETNPEEGFDSVDYEGGEFASLFKSQCESEIPDFTLDEQYASQQKYDSQMKKNVALYRDMNAVVVNISDDDEEEDVDTGIQYKNRFLDPSQPTMPTHLFNTHSPLPTIRMEESPIREESAASTLLKNMAMGMYNTPSPLRKLPSFQSNQQHQSDTHESEDDISLSKEGLRHVSPQSSVIRKPKRRLKQRGSPQEKEVYVYDPPSTNQFLEKLKKCKDDSPGKSTVRSKVPIDNPFFDIEAEQSSDEGHTTDGESTEGGSSLLMNSFIDDGEGSMIQDTQEERQSRPDIYRQSLLEENTPKKHWMNRFNAEKWLNAAEDDNIIEEEEEELDSEQSVQELFESEHTIQELFENDNDDDDFV